MRVLVIGHVWPEPRSSAAGSRMLELIDSFIASRWQVDFATPAVPSVHQIDLAERQVDCHKITLNCDSFDRLVSGLRPAIVVFDRFMTEEQYGWRVARACPSALQVLDSEDLHCLRNARHGRLKGLQVQAGNEPVSDQALSEYMTAPQAVLFQWMSAEELAYREIAAIQRCDLTLVISEFELTLLTRQFSVASAKLHYCPFMRTVDASPQIPFEQRLHFISIGNFRHAPNWDAVLWLKQALWPKIRSVLPTAELHLYGAYPPSKATALHNPRQGFLVKGWARDAGQVLSQARVCLAPLRFGAGLKGKLVDAMAAGTPSITTTIGAEAMAGTHPWPGIVANDVAAWVAGAVDLYSTAEHWRKSQLDGFELLRERFDSQLHREKLIDKLQEAHANLAALRQADFTGGMLRHHFHQSTRYMSRWIEAKGRLREQVDT